MTAYKKMVLSVLAPMFLLPSLSFASGDSGAQVIKKLMVSKGKVVKIWGESGKWGNPDVCNNSTYIILDPGTSATPNEYYSEMYILLVSSFIQGKQVSATLNGCTRSRPRIGSIRAN